MVVDVPWIGIALRGPRRFIRPGRTPAPAYPIRHCPHPFGGEPARPKHRPGRSVFIQAKSHSEKEPFILSLKLRAALRALVFAALPAALMAQPNPGVFGPGPGRNVFPAPASVGATVGLSYFGPPPSSANPSLVGPVQLLKSGVVDDKAGTLTLPLYRGTLNGSNQPVWFIITDLNDAQVADFLGINCSTKLNFTANGARNAWFDTDNNIVFDGGAVDFTPAHKVVAGSAGAPFPPTTADPGSVGDDDYSPSSSSATSSITPPSSPSEKRPPPSTSPPAIPTTRRSMTKSWPSTLRK